MNTEWSLSIFTEAAWTSAPEFLVKATVVLALAWVGYVAIRRRNPRWRMALWRTVLALVVLLFRRRESLDAEVWSEMSG